MEKVLKEEGTGNDIKGALVEAEVNFQGSQIGDADERSEGTSSYMGFLNHAVADVVTWEENIQTKIEHVQIPNTHTYIPKSDDPYYRLLKKSIAFLIKIKDERDRVEEWLKQHQN